MAESQDEKVKLCRPKNPHLSSLESDFLYHIGYSSGDCREAFKDVKVLCEITVIPCSMCTAVSASYVTGALVV
jgi:hypothetical protein